MDDRSLVYPDAREEAFAEKLERLANLVRCGAFKPERLSHYTLRGGGNTSASPGTIARSLPSFKRYGITFEWEERKS